MFHRRVQGDLSQNQHCNHPVQLEFSKQNEYNYLKPYCGNTKNYLYFSKCMTSGIAIKSFLTSVAGNQLLSGSEAILYDVVFSDVTYSNSKSLKQIDMKYSSKVHTAAWTTIAMAILGISLSAIGAMFNSNAIGIISAFSIAICGIALMTWIEIARRERTFH